MPQAVDRSWTFDFSIVNCKDNHTTKSLFVWVYHPQFFFSSYIFLPDQWSNTWQPLLSHNLGNITYDPWRWCLSVTVYSLWPTYVFLPFTGICILYTQYTQYTVLMNSRKRETYLHLLLSFTVVWIQKKLVAIYALLKYGYLNWYIGITIMFPIKSMWFSSHFHR